jgi:hypothetical protein
MRTFFRQVRQLPLGKVARRTDMVRSRLGTSAYTPQDVHYGRG